jgi:predicted methyltransferase
VQIAAKPEFARAIASAFTADIERNPDVKLALIGRRLDRDGLARLALRDQRRFPNTYGLVRRIAKDQGIDVPPGLGQWEAIASVISAAAGAATKVYTSKVEAEAQKKLAELEVQKQQAAIKTAELQAKLAQAQYQAAETAARQQTSGSGSGSVLTKEVVPGVPLWGVVGAGVVTLGVAGYLLLKPKSRTRR